MKKQRLLMLFALVAVFCVSWAFTACKVTEHTHTYSSDWTYDETYHWRKATCEHSDQVSDKDKHTFDGNECTVCKYNKSNPLPPIDGSCQVTFNANGGELTGTAVQTVDKNAVLTEPSAPARDGFVFDGWAKDEEGAVKWNFAENKVTENLTLYAQWLELFPVVFDANGGKFESEQATYSQEVAEGGKLTAPALPTRQNFEFTRWYADDKLTTEWNFETDTVTKATTLYAGWKFNEVNVTYALNYPSAENVTQKTTNGLVTYIPSRVGYVFNGWWFSDGQTADGEYILAQKWDMSEVVTESNLTLYAEWVEKATVSSQLTAPSVSINGNVFSWNEVDNAVRYDIRVYKSNSNQELTSANVSGTSWTFPDGYEAGYYNVKVRAIGDGLNTVNSSYVTKSYGHLILGGISSIEFDISTSVLTWSPVKNATAYELYINNALADTLSYATYDLSEYEAGSYQIKIIATRNNYQSSTASKAIEKKRLKTPEVDVYVIEKDASYILLWDNVLHADTYIIVYGDKEIRVDGNRFVFDGTSNVWGNANSVTLSVNAYDSNADYLVSIKPMEIKLNKLYKLTTEASVEGAGSVTVEGGSFSQKVYLSQTFNVTFDLNYAGGAKDVVAVTSTEGLKAPAIPKRNGYYFGGWYCESECKNRYDFSSTITKNITLYAKWGQEANDSLINCYAIDISSYNGNLSYYSLSASGTSSTTYNTVSFVIPQKGNYYLYYANSSSSSNYSIGVSVFKVPGGRLDSFTANSTSYKATVFNANAGDIVEIMINRLGSYTGSLKFYLTGEVDADADGKSEYLQYLTEGNNSDLASNLVACGTEITLVATANNGYAWQGWYDGENLLTREQSYSFTMSADNATYTAKWTKLEINGNSKFAGTHTVLDGKYVLGEQVTVTAVTDERYVWQGWYDGETLLTENESYTFAIPSTDVSYTAKWLFDTQYIDENGQTKNFEGADIQFIEDSENSTLSGWYYVSSGKHGEYDLTVNGTARILLADGCDWDFYGNIEVPVGNALYIYAQSQGDSVGRLSCTNIGGLHGKNGVNGDNGNSRDTQGKPGISGTKGNDSGTIIINGGVISAYNIGGGNGGYGGGGGFGYTGSGGSGADGKDGSDGGSSEKIVINGGVIKAYNIGGGNGGTGGFGGLSGSYSYADSHSGDSGNGGKGGNSGVIEINGGQVTADNIGGGNGGNGNKGYKGGNGGNGGSCGVLIIKNGCVTKSFTCGKAGVKGESGNASTSAVDGTNGSKATVYFVGTEQDFQQSLGAVENVQVYFFSETEPTSSGNYWHYDDDGVTPVVW